MAEQKVSIVITGDSSNAQSAVQGLSASTVALGNLLSTAVTKAFEVLSSAIQGAVVQMQAAVAASAEQEKNQLLLINAMKTAGVFTRQAFQDNMDLASSLQATTKYADENIMAVQKELTIYGAAGKQLEDLTQLTLDFASAKGMDLQSAGALIAKTIGSESNALARYGIEIQGAAGSTERMTSATEGLSKLFGGTAQAEAKSFSGGIEQIKNAWDDVYETVGDVITQNEASGVIFDYVKKAIAGLNAWILKHKDDLMLFVKTALMATIDGFIFLVGVFKTVVTVLGMVGTGFMTLGSIILKVVSFAIGGWEMLLKVISDGLGKIPVIGEKFKAAGDAITSVFTDARASVDALAGNFDTTGAAIAETTIKVTENMTALQDGATGFKNAIEAAGNAAVTVLDKVDVAATEKQSAMIAKNKATVEQLKVIWKTGSDIIVKTSSMAADLMLQNQMTLGQALEVSFKKTLAAQLEAEIDKSVASISVKAAEEIGKATLAAPLTFGLSLLAIGAIVAAATVAKAAIRSVAGFAQGGIVGEGGSRIPLPSGTAQLAQVHEGEVIGTPTRLAAAGVGGVSVVFNNYGNIADEVDVSLIAEKIATRIKNELRSSL